MNLLQQNFMPSPVGEGEGEVRVFESRFFVPITLVLSIGEGSGLRMTSLNDSVILGIMSKRYW